MRWWNFRLFSDECVAAALLERRRGRRRRRALEYIVAVEHHRADADEDERVRRVAHEHNARVGALGAQFARIGVHAHQVVASRSFFSTQN